MKCSEAELKPREYLKMSFGQVCDWLHGYEMRQARADNRARVIASAMVGASPQELWPIPLLDDTNDQPIEAIDEATAIALLNSYF